MTEYSVLMSEAGRFKFIADLKPEKFGEVIADGKVVIGKVNHELSEVETREKYINGRHVESFEVISDGE